MGLLDPVSCLTLPLFLKKYWSNQFACQGSTNITDTDNRYQYWYWYDLIIGPSVAVQMVGHYFCYCFLFVLAAVSKTTEGRLSVCRPGSEDPHRCQQKFRYRYCFEVKYFNWYWYLFDMNLVYWFLTYIPLYRYTNIGMISVYTDYWYQYQFDLNPESVLV